MDDDWGDISCGFNPADETINFKSRCFGDDLNDLHEVTTVAVIHSKNQEIGNVTINSINNNGQSFLSVQNSIKVFRDLFCSDICFTGIFETNIQAISVTNDGEYMFLCLETNICICIHVPTEKICFQKSLQEWVQRCDSSCINIFILDVDKTTNIIFVFSNGAIISLEAVNGAIQGEPCLLHSFDSDITCACLNSGNVLLLVGETKLFMYNCTHKNVSSVSDKFEKWIKVCPVDRALFLALNENGGLFCLCAVTHIYSLLNSDMKKLADFMYVSDKNNSYIYAYTLPDENKCAYLQLYDFPSMQLLFNIKQENGIALTMPGNSSEDLMYVESTSKDLFVKKVTETQAENRLLKLLQRERFDEAESFARQHDLDMETIWKHHADFYVQKLICSSKEIDSLIAQLKKITDVDFVIERCLDTTCNQFEDVQKILEYANQRIQADESAANGQQYSECKAVLEGVLLRLDTFKLLENVYCTRQEADEKLLHKWRSFRDADLILRINQLMSSFELAEASVLFARLDAKTKLEVDTSTIYMLLQAIPATIHQNDCVQFLRKFIPVALALVPDCLPELIAWLLKKVHQIEKMHTSQFPENALDLLDAIVAVFVAEVPEHSRSLQKVYECRHSVQLLIDLKRNHALLLTLDSMSQLPQTIAITLMKERIDDDFKRFWNGFLFDYLVENGLVPDEILFLFVQEFMYENPFDWEETVVRVLTFIECVMVKMEMSVMILENGEVPWNDAIVAVADEALRLVHPDVDKVRKLVVQMPVKCIVKKYDYGNVDCQNKMKMLFFIGHIIKRNKESKLEDIEELCASFPDILFEGRLLCITDYIENGRYGEALDMIDKYPLQSLKFCENILTQISVMVRSKRLCRNTLPHYMEIIEMLKHRINKLKKGVHYTDSFITDLKNMYNLDNYQPQNKDKCLSESIAQMIEGGGKMGDGKEGDGKKGDGKVGDDDEELCRKVGHLSRALGMRQEQGWLQLMRASTDYGVLRTAMRCIYECSDLSEYLAPASVILLLELGTETNNTDFDKNETLLPDAKNLCAVTPVDATAQLETLRLIESAVAKAVCNAPPEHTTACWHLAEWISICYSFTRSTVNPVGNQHMLYLDVYHKVLSIYQKLIEIVGAKDPYLKFVAASRDATISTSELRERIESLWQITNQLGTGFESLMTVQTFIKTLLKSLMAFKSTQKLSPSLLQSLDGLVTNMDKRLLHMVSTGKGPIDFRLALMLMKQLQRADADKCLQTYIKYSYLNDVNKFFELSRLAVVYEGTAAKASKHRDDMTRLKWWKRLHDCGVAFADFFKAPPHALVRMFLHRKEMTLEHVQEFCVDYELDLQLHYGYLLLEKLKWKPQYEVRTDVNQRRVLHVVEPRLYEQCLPIVRLMDGKPVSTLLRNAWEQVNFYHYEVFACIYKLLNWVNADVAQDLHNHRLILVFLGQYVRESEPREREQELWYTAFPSLTMLDPLSEWRLPNIFGARRDAQSIGNALELIRSEITLLNYKDWFGVAHLLGLKTNDICIYAIKSTISKSMLKSGNDNQWNLQLKHTAVLNSINECVQHITNREDATAVLNAVLNCTSGGADLVEITKLCYEYAKKWKEEAQDAKLKQVYLKIQKKYHTNSATHVLHLYQLTRERYLQRVGDADQLIECLYDDERIVQNDPFACPNINEAVDNVATIYEMDVQTKRVQLLNRWLSVYSSVASTDLAACEDNAKKIIYLCKCEQKSILIDYLITISLRPVMNETAIDMMTSITDIDITYNTRYYALRCLNAIIEQDRIEEVTGKSSYELINLLDQYRIVSDLTAVLGLALTPEKLDDYNKSHLIVSLTRSRNAPNAAVKLLSAICRHYKLHKTNYWEFIIERMSVLNMVDELFENLNYISKNSNVFSCKWFINGWEKVIELWLNEKSNVESECFQNVCIKTLQNITVCPILSKLNVEKICQQYIDVGKPEFAAMLLYSIPSNIDKKKLLEQILQEGKESIINNLQLLADDFCKVHIVIEKLRKCETNVRECLVSS